MSSNSNGQITQAAQCRSTDKVVHIPTSMDPTTGERIVLWHDIQAIFERAQSVKNGDSLVPFMSGEDSDQ